MKTIAANSLPQLEFYRYLIGAVGPRPIAFASTISLEGHVNLSPYSFFNVVGSNPPMLMLSPNLNRNGHKKHTLLNLEETGEVVINIVNYNMVEQMSLSSAEYDRHVNEFQKAGFTEVPSSQVRPPRVAEAPAAFECVVRQIIPTGANPGAGTLVLAEVLVGHFRDDIFTDKGLIDPRRIDLIGRMGADWYVRANGEALFEVARPKAGIGYDALPAPLRNSNILTGNDLGKLASLEALPADDEVRAYGETPALQELASEARTGCQYLPDVMHHRAHQLLAGNNVREAWLSLLLVTTK
ncbi:flavin reductase family protein [Fibrella forsythiae]|uniref:Flavin reductase family protein n=1 Tax=Fibrella forsythiae TaxID=2817061 RepID=A0ABS3JKE0_9BACT|nr:flavin reductase family protein [Fibrella forsythiae]MBO0949876.1 flavin reductase family protein [Fibrella forsythiae]